MLKIKNSSGEELLTIKDDGTEQFGSQKFKEEYEQAEKEQEQQSEGE